MAGNDADAKDGEVLSLSQDVKRQDQLSQIIAKRARLALNPPAIATCAGAPPGAERE